MISVVMSVYNAEKHLDEAIQSILNQTYKNFEFIIINDGSTDKSLEIIEKYKSQDTRIVFISRENRGLVASLNEGIELAQGKYIARMDADDISLPQRFEKQIHFMKENELDVCGSWISKFRGSSNLGITKYPEDDANIKFRLLFMSSFAHPTVIFKKSILDTDSKYRNVKAEDYQLWTELALAGFRMGNVPQILLKYRVHKNQLTKNKKELNLSSKLISTHYSANLGEEELKLTNSISKLTTEIDYKLFHQVLNDILIYSKKFNFITEENILAILKKILVSVKRSPIYFFIYLKVLRSFKLKPNNNFVLFIKMFKK